MSSFRKKICRVCGDTASGFNFNGLSCESCKIFFRRNAFRAEKLICGRGNCNIDSYTRKCCQKCRLEKCFEIGMQKEMIKSKIFNKNIEMNQNMSIILNKRAFSLYEEQLLNDLQEAMSIFPDESKLPIVQYAIHMAEAYNLINSYAREIVKYCKCFSVFKNLQQNDQLAILKLFFCSIQTIRFSFVYCEAEEGFPMLKSNEENAAIFIKISIFRQYKDKLVETYFREFLSSLFIEMENDANIRNLLIAYMLFVPIESISCPELLRYQQYVYRHLLHRYLQEKYTCPEKAQKKFDCLIEMMANLSTVRYLGQQVFYDFAPGETIELMDELFDSKEPI